LTIKKLYPKTSAGNIRPIAASNSSVAQTRRQHPVNASALVGKYLHK
jgi:hypothetical protein